MAEKDTIVDNLSGRWKNPLNDFFSNGFVAIAFARFNGDIVDANSSFLDLFGFSKEELNSGELNWKKFTPHEFLATTNAI